MHDHPYSAPLDIQHATVVPSLLFCPRCSCCPCLCHAITPHVPYIPLVPAQPVRPQVVPVPAPDVEPPLTAEEIRVLREWIRGGVREIRRAMRRSRRRR